MITKHFFDIISDLAIISGKNVNLDFVVLAAGSGSRMKSSTPKIFQKIAGKPVIQYIIDTCNKIDHQNLIVVTTNELSDHQLFSGLKTAIQGNQKGTGSAVIAALPNLHAEYTIIMCGDMPLIEPKYLQMLSESSADISFIAMEIPEHLRKMPYGRVILDPSNEFIKIIEYADASIEEKECILANTGLYKIKTEILKKYINSIPPNPSNGELYFTDILEIAKNNNASIAVLISSEYWPFHGINTMADLANAEHITQERLRKKFMENGVKLISPQTTFFSHDTEISNDVLIESNVVIKENVKISKGVEIKSFSYLEHCYINNGVKIGPFARIRGNSTLQQDSEIGNFVEVKGSTVGPQSKAKHLAYIGDSAIGTKVNIGAGVITVNYDGIKKHKTIIEDYVMVGSNCSIIAPITLGQGAILGAGSVITKDVPENSLAISRTRQDIKVDKAIEIREKKKKNS